MIALWGLREDPPLAAVSSCLEGLGVPTVIVDQRRIPEYVFELETSGVEGKIVGPGGALDISEINSIYVRPYNFADLDIFHGVDPASETWRRAASFEESMLAWCDLTPAFVVNRPMAMGSNSSKPFQMEIIRAAGFQVPETLITTDPDEVVRFSKQHRHVIYKSISSWRSIVSRLSNDDLRRVEDVVCCPTQFQEFIEGTDYRVHVLNETAFAHRIDCADDDYRYSERAQIEAARLEGDLENRCISLAKKLSLVFAGIDLRRSVQGDWYCFEVNPSPGFSYFDRDSGTISLTLAKQLSIGYEM
jgi:hypothetical protein